MRDYMDRQVTSPAWDPPPPCKQALKALSILSELTSQTIPVVIRISLFMKTIQPDQSNPK